MTKFSISDFKEQFSKDFAPSSHFFVKINRSGSTDSEKARFLTFAAAMTTIPGVEIETTPARRFGVGLEYQYATSARNVPVNIAFLGDGGGIILDYFQKWTNQVFTYGDQGNSESNDPYLFKAYYKNQYAATIELELFNRDKQQYGVYSLRKAFPIRIGQTDLAWRNTEYMMFQITFVFDSYVWSPLATTDPISSSSKPFDEAKSVIDRATDFLASQQPII